eukprot:Nk52_evm7s273 gene=Nk52_evmTU7s273
MSAASSSSVASSRLAAVRSIVRHLRKHHIDNKGPRATGSRVNLSQMSPWEQKITKQGHIARNYNFFVRGFLEETKNTKKDCVGGDSDLKWARALEDLATYFKSNHQHKELVKEFHLGIENKYTTKQLTEMSATRVGLQLPQQPSYEDEEGSQEGKDGESKEKKH